MKSRLMLMSIAAAATFASACAVERDPNVERTNDARTLELENLSEAQIEGVLSMPGEARLFVTGQDIGAGMRASDASQEGGALLLSFRFPLVPNASYSLHHPALSEPLELAGEPRAATPPGVIGVLPDAHVLPSNVLRLYVVFDEPMSSKFLMSQAVEVVDLEDGATLDAALLDLEQPLFDRTNTRLTVIFNPGRTKRGVGSNLEGGPPLKPGREYALRVKSGLLDAQGDALEQDAEFVFRTTQPNRDPLDVSRWQVHEPRAGSRDALTIEFERWLDPFQAEHRIALTNPHGRRVPMSSKSDGRTLRFVPLEGWSAGCYAMTVSHELEDVSGNRTIRAFDERGKGPRQPRVRRIGIGADAACPP